MFGEIADHEETTDRGMSAEKPVKGMLARPGAKVAKGMLARSDSKAVKTCGDFPAPLAVISDLCGIRCKVK